MAYIVIKSRCYRRRPILPAHHLILLPASPVTSARYHTTVHHSLIPKSSHRSGVSFVSKTCKKAHHQKNWKTVHSLFSYFTAVNSHQLTYSLCLRLSKLWRRSLGPTSFLSKAQGNLIRLTDHIFQLSRVISPLLPYCCPKPPAMYLSSAIRPFINGGRTTFAIRGAGQQPLASRANVEGGITLDLRLLTGIDLNLENGIVSISAGERWGAVYEKLAEHNLGVTGSRSAKGGIGGLALSGSSTNTFYPHPIEENHTELCF